jgi:hypothetical protein
LTLIIAAKHRWLLLSARRVYMPKITHFHQSHSNAAVSQALEWMKRALKPETDEWTPSNQQIWQIKEGNSE